MLHLPQSLKYIKYSVYRENDLQYDPKHPSDDSSQ